MSNYYNPDPYGNGNQQNNGYGGQQQNGYQQPSGNQQQNHYNNYVEMQKQVLFYKTQAKEERRQIRQIGNMMGACVLAFLIIQFIASFVLVSNRTAYALYQTSSVFQDSYGILFVELLAVVMPFGVMAFLNRDKYTETPLIPNKHIKITDLGLWVGFGMVCCIAADYIVAMMMSISQMFGYELTQSESLAPENLFACLMSVLSTAVVPAVCEEFAMRCCSLGLLKKYGKAFGVIAVSLVFGLLHGNLIQFVFATIVGLVLGFVTVKTDSVIPAVLIHGFNNGMSVVVLVVEYFFNSDAGDNISAFMFIFWIVVGIACAIILAVKHKLSLTESKPKQPFANTLPMKVGAFISSPVLIISSFYLIYSVLTSIQSL